MVPEKINVRFGVGTVAAVGREGKGGAGLQQIPFRPVTIA
jgi:hypothetical protein